MTGSDGYLDKLLAAYNDFLPQLDLLPVLSDAEVDRYVALGDSGDGLLRSGDREKAEAAFRAQLAICPVNPAPHVSLGLIAAMRGAKKNAVEHLRDAVLRGFTDLGRLERSEGWAGVRDDPQFLALQDAIPMLLAAERKYAGWETFKAWHAPESVAHVLRGREIRAVAVARVEPVVGPRYARLCKRVNDRAAAALLEAYVVERPDAADLESALGSLMTLYAGGSAFRWERLSPESARRLESVAGVVLERFPKSAMRPGALACRALASYALRDKDGAIRPAAVATITTALGEVLENHVDAPFAAAAAEGLVRTEIEAGRRARAAEWYAKFRTIHVDDAAMLDDVRERLGPLALWVGGVPAFAATALDGATVDRGALNGKVAVIDFWATWCQPCRDQFPVLRRIEERHADKVVMLGVSLDDSEDLSVEALKAWVAQQKVPGRHLYDGRGWSSDLVKAFGVKEIPFSVVVGRDGAVWAVAEQGRRLEKAVAEAVK